MNIIPDYIVLAYFILGIGFGIFKKKIAQWYIIILYFMLFKIIFNYKKCTVSYFECKLRNVKKEKGYLYRFLDKFINLRYEPYKHLIIILYTIFFSLFYFYRGNKIKL